MMKFSSQSRNGPSNVMVTLPEINSPQLDDFCRICLLRKAQLRPLSSQIDTVMIPEMLYKVTGTMLNMNEPLPRVICERCLTKLELAYTISEEFRKQEELLRRFWWKGGMLVDELVAYGQLEESRWAMHSDGVIERLAGKRMDEASQDQQSTGSGLADLDEDFGMGQEDTLLPVEQSRPLVKPEYLDGTAYSTEIPADDDDFEEDSFPILEKETTKQHHNIFDNGLEMVLELEDLQTIGAIPAALLKQLDTYTTPRGVYDQDGKSLLLPLGSKKRRHKAKVNPALDDEDGDDESVPSDLDVAEEDVSDVEFHPRSSQVSAKKKFWLQKGDFECDVCKKVFHSRRTWYVHTKKHNNRKEIQFRCVHCNKLCKNQQDLDAHELSHRELASGKMKYPCIHCRKVFTSGTELKRHDCEHEPLPGKTTPPFVTTTNDLDSDEKTDTETETGFNDEPAPMEVENRFPYCDECDAYFLNQLSLRVHMFVHAAHQDQAPTEQFTVVAQPDSTNDDATTVSLWNCNECGSTLTSARSLPQHKLRHTYLQNLRFKCDICKLAFPAAHIYRQHRVKAHGLVNRKQSSKKLKCPLCCKFIKKDTVEQHIKAHENIQLKYYACELCKTAFGNERRLKAHTIAKRCSQPGYILKSTKRKPPIDLRAYFAQLDQRKPASRAMPANRKAPNGPTRADSMALLEKQDDGKYKCKKCGKTIKRLKNATMHSRRHIILEQGIYKCEICQQALGSRFAFNEHVKSKH